jgi:Tol biopolymer transport system component
MSSLLSAVPIANRSIAYGFLLAGVTILSSGGFTMLPLLANQFSASATFSGEEGTKIAFTSDRDVNKEIYVMAADGTGQTRLTDNAAFDFLPSWSPDGTKIAFTSDRDGNVEVYVMNAQDGSNQTRLTDNAASDGLPDWMYRTR